MNSRRLTTILATTLTAVTAPQLARAAQPEGDASGGVSAGASLGAGTETEPDASATATGSGDNSGSGDSSGGGDSPGTTSGAPVVVSNVYDGVEGKLRLHFDIDFLVQPSFLNYLDLDSPVFAQPLYGLGLGYGVHRNFVIGAKFGFNFIRVRNRDEDLIAMGIREVERNSNGFFAPYFEYLPIATGRILPFLGARAGFGWATSADRQKGEVLGTVIDTGSRTTQLAPLLGTSAGAHFFLTPSFSIDAAALFDVRWNFGRTRVLGPAAGEPSDWAPSSSVMNLGLTLGLSGWF